MHEYDILEQFAALEAALRKISASGGDARASLSRGKAKFAIANFAALDRRVNRHIMDTRGDG